MEVRARRARRDGQPARQRSWPRLMQGPVSPPVRLISPYPGPHRSGRDWPWRQVSFDPAPVKRPSTEPCARRRPASDSPCSFTASISPFAPGLHRVQEHVERRNLQHVLVLVLVVLVTVVVIVVTVVVLSCAPPFPTRRICLYPHPETLQQVGHGRGCAIIAGVYRNRDGLEQHFKAGGRSSTRRPGGASGGRARGRLNSAGLCYSGRLAALPAAPPLFATRSPARNLFCHRDHDLLGVHPVLDEVRRLGGRRARASSSASMAVAAASAAGSPARGSAPDPARSPSRRCLPSGQGSDAKDLGVPQPGSTVRLRRLPHPSLRHGRHPQAEDVADPHVVAEVRLGPAGRAGGTPRSVRVRSKGTDTIRAEIHCKNSA